MKAKRIIGRNYKPPCGNCEALPWEACECSFEPLSATAEGVSAENYGAVGDPSARPRFLMGAALKDIQAPDLSGIDLAEALALLAREVKIETASPTARAAYDKLLTGLAKNDIAGEMQKSRWSEVRKDGPQTLHVNAKEMRAAWEWELKERLIESHNRGEWLSRAQLVSHLKTFSFGRYTGKKGNQIQSGTIATWMTIATENRIRTEATTLALKARK